MEKVYMKQQQKIASMMRTQTTDTTNNITKHSRVENYTNIQFTHDEIQLLNKGLKYNLHYKNKKWIETLALEAETAITNLDINNQNYYRHAVAKKIKEISKNNQINNKKTKEEWKQIMNIKNKIDTNRLIITRADTRKTLVILQKKNIIIKYKTLYRKPIS
jgi:predicted glycosyltransferase involved in capsule biosynthesis